MRGTFAEVSEAENEEDDEDEDEDDESGSEGEDDSSDEYEDEGEGEDDQSYDDSQLDNGRPRASHARAKSGQNTKFVGHHRLISKQFDENHELYSTELDQTMEKKYLERSMQQSRQQRKGQHGQGKTTYNPDFADKFARGTVSSRASYDRSLKKRMSTGQGQKRGHSGKKHNMSIQRGKLRAAANDQSLEFQKHYNMRVNETNPHTDREDYKRSRFENLSPHSRMILQHEQ